MAPNARHQTWFAAHPKDTPSGRAKFMRRSGQLPARIAIALLLLFAGCHAKPRAASGPAARVVSLSPNTTETLFAMGAGSKLVGRSRFCDYPPEAKSLPSVGGYVDPSLEAILALSPDLVAGARGPAGPALVEKLGALGIATYFPTTESMAEIEAMIDGLGARVGAAEKAREVVTKLRARRDEIARAVSGRKRVRVLLVFGVNPIVAAGPDSFPNEMLLLANGQNVVTTGSGYPTLSVERLMTLEPDVVVNASMAGTPDGQGDGIQRDAPGWRELDAVRDGRIVAIHDEAVLRPGPRIGEGLAVLARAIHPEASVP
jgi:iron complex transport system substrate-binding protein